MKEFDYIRIQVKDEFFDRVIASYSSFGWEVFEINDSQSFFETKDVTLSRKHHIEEKDKLQLYQVYMENSYSKLNKINKSRYSTSVVVGLSVGLLALALVCIAIFFAVKTPYVWLRVISIILACCACLVLVVLLFALKKIKNSEDLAFHKNVNRIKREIEDVCLKAKQIWENDDDGKNQLEG